MSRSVSDGGTPETVSYQYEAASNRLLSLSDAGGSETYEHDAQGNMLAIDGGACGLGGGPAYVYGFDNRLAEVCDGGFTIAAFAHNALAERVLADTGQIAHFHYDRAGRPIAETDAAGALVRANVWLNGEPLAQLTPDGAGGLRLLYIETDHLGTPTCPP